MNHSDHGESRPCRLYRDPEQGVIRGVCAGIANHFDCPPWLMRIGALALGWFFTVPAIIAYIMATLLIPERPLHYCGDGDERSFWQSGNRRS